MTVTFRGRIEIFRNFSNCFENFVKNIFHFENLEIFIWIQLTFCCQTNFYSAFSLMQGFLIAQRFRSVRRPVTFWVINTTSVQLPVKRELFWIEEKVSCRSTFLSELLYLFLHSSYILELHTLLHINKCKILFCQPSKLGFKIAQWTIT